jgi:hypothetical protein
MAAGLVPCQTSRCVFGHVGRRIFRDLVGMTTTPGVEAAVSRSSRLPASCHITSSPTLPTARWVGECFERSWPTSATPADTPSIFPQGLRWHCPTTAASSTTSDLPLRISQALVKNQCSAAASVRQLEQQPRRPSKSAYDEHGPPTSANDCQWPYGREFASRGSRDAQSVARRPSCLLASMLVRHREVWPWRVAPKGTCELSGRSYRSWRQPVSRRGDPRAIARSDQGQKRPLSGRLPRCGNGARLRADCPVEDR